MIKNRKINFSIQLKYSIERSSICKLNEITIQYCFNLKKEKNKCYYIKKTKPHHARHFLMYYKWHSLVDSPINCDQHNYRSNRKNSQNYEHWSTGILIYETLRVRTLPWLLYKVQKLLLRCS